jgi:hypothetical protein
MEVWWRFTRISNAPSSPPAILAISSSLESSLSIIPETFFKQTLVQRSFTSFSPERHTRVKTITEGSENYTARE